MTWPPTNEVSPRRDSNAPPTSVHQAHLLIIATVKRVLALLVLAACGTDQQSLNTTDQPTIATMRSGLAMSGAGGCDTGIANGLNAQLIEELNCVQANLMVNFKTTNYTLYSGVHSWLAADAARDLEDARRARNDTMTISSAYRTLGQQYLLYRWWRAGQCGIQVAAVPGQSNHQSGRAIDTPYYSTWRTALSAQGWTWLGSSDVVHFDHLASPNVASKSVLAFQKLWNKNHTTGRLAEDGSWGPATEAAMAASPTTGFSTHGCATTGKLSGTITSGGTALSGVTVTASGRTVTTAANGAFEFTLAAGSVTVSASKSGYVTATVTKTVVVGSTVNASLSLAAVATTGTLRGTVVDASNTSPLPDAAVSVAGRMLTTNAMGVFEVELPAGTVTITVAKNGFTSSTSSVAITAGMIKTTQLALTASNVDGAPTLEVSSPTSASSTDFARVTLTGIATDDGAPLTTLSFTHNGSAAVTSPIANGTFNLELVLAAGVNTVVLSVADTTGHRTDVTWTQTFRAGMSGVVHRFDDAAFIIADAELEAFDPDTGISLGRTRTDVEGRFELVTSAVGLQRLTVTKEGFTTRDLVIVVPDDERGTVDVGLTPGDFVELRFIEPKLEDGLINADEVTVSGVVTGLEIASVTVNGVQATLLGNGFVAKVPLAEGATVLTATAESAEGVSVTATMNVGRPLSAAHGGCSTSAGLMVILALLLPLSRARRLG